MAMSRALTTAAMAKFSTDLNENNTKRSLSKMSIFNGQITPLNVLTNFTVGAGGAFFAEIGFYPFEGLPKKHFVKVPKANGAVKTVFNYKQFCKDWSYLIKYKVSGSGLLVASFGVYRAGARVYLKSFYPAEQALISAAAAVATQTAVMYPLNKAYAWRAEQMTAAAKSGAMVKTPNIGKAMVQMAKAKGLGSLYKGYITNYTIAAPTLMGYYTMDEVYLKALKAKWAREHPENPIVPWYIPAIAGTGGSLTAILFASPVEYLRETIVNKKAGTKLMNPNQKVPMKVTHDSLHVSPRYTIKKITGPVVRRTLNQAPETIRQTVGNSLKASLKGPTVRDIIKRIILRH